MSADTPTWRSRSARTASGGSIICVSYLFSTKYQSSNQWVLEIVGGAQGGGSDRHAVQSFLAAAGFRPAVLRTAGILGQVLYALTERNAHFDDHPLHNRLHGRL